MVHHGNELEALRAVQHPEMRGRIALEGPLVLKAHDDCSGRILPDVVLGGHRDEAGPEEEEHRRSVLPPSQIAAPIRAVLNVRTPGQGRRGVRDVEELSKLFDPHVRSYRFVYDGCDDDVGSAPPLSWHLTAGQKRELDDTWDGCPGRPRAKPSSYDKRAKAIVEHILGAGPREFTTIQPTTAQP